MSSLSPRDDQDGGKAARRGQVAPRSGYSQKESGLLIVCELATSMNPILILKNMLRTINVRLIQSTDPKMVYSK
jgi:hypothetical protein